MTSDGRRKSTHSSNELLNQKDHPIVPSGFINKLVSDIKKLYVYQPNESVKWMNEKPKNRKAYEPTEVFYRFFFLK